MSDATTSITCPHCQQIISLDDALTHQIENKFKHAFDTQLQEEKVRLWKVAQEKALEKIKSQQDQETKFLKEELAEKNKALENARAFELEIRKQKNKLEEDKKAFELEKQRQLDSERDKIKNEVTKILSEEHQLKDAEKEKKIHDMLKTIEELKRKGEQGSQQLQGEVLELELEGLLKTEFPYDEIQPVGKGISGADVIQKVFDRQGRNCGTIVWESKRTKAWSDGWVQKLKDDQRNIKAEIAVLVTNVLPAEIKHFGPKDGIYITAYEHAIGLATLLRNAIIQVALTKLANNGKDAKMEVLWNYLTGTEFKQRMEAIYEAFVAMKVDLDREKRVYTKLWAKREKQIQRVLDSTSGMRGELEGLMGSALPQIKTLELPDEVEEEEEVV